MELYGQEPEVGLLAAFLTRLETTTVVDVGAERGAFAEAILRAGSEAVHAIEPEPANVAELRRRFADEPRVTVHDLAVSDRDGRLELHVSVDAAGEPISFGHTVLERPDTAEIGWREVISIEARSLASLVEAGALPARVGIVKIDTEGHDFAVVAGMGALEADVVVVEHWTDLPLSLGRCPWTTDEMVGALRPRGFSHFAFVLHRRELVTLRWDNGDVPAGQMGNLIFVHERVYETLLPDIVACSSTLADRAAELAEARTEAAAERLAVIEELAEERDVQAQAAEERLETINRLVEES